MFHQGVPGMIFEQHPKASRPKCVICRTGYLVPAIPTTVHSCVYPNCKNEDKSIPICEYHATMFNNWSKMETEEFKIVHKNMKQIIERYFKRRA